VLLSPVAVQVVLHSQRAEAEQTERVTSALSRTVLDRAAGTLLANGSLKMDGSLEIDRNHLGEELHHGHIRHPDKPQQRLRYA
jgi:hypothetical protein